MKLKDGKYLKIEWDTNKLKVVDKKYMDKYMAKMLKEGLSGVTMKDEIEDVTRQYEWDSNNFGKGYTEIFIGNEIDMDNSFVKLD